MLLGLRLIIGILGIIKSNTRLAARVDGEGVPVPVPGGGLGAAVKHTGVFMEPLLKNLRSSKAALFCCTCPSLFECAIMSYHCGL